MAEGWRCLRICRISVGNRQASRVAGAGFIHNCDERLIAASFCFRFELGRRFYRRTAFAFQNPSTKPKYAAIKNAVSRSHGRD